MISPTRALALSAGCFFLSSTSQGAESEWPQFRGPNGQGISEAKNLPITWSDTENVRWKVEVPGRAWSSPVISKDRIYLTTAIGGTGTEKPDVTLHALCLDAADGHLIWNVEVFKPEGAATAAMHRKNSLASPTPIVTADRLFVHFGHMGTAALDLAGKIVWKQTTLAYSPVHGTGGSPILVDGSLIFSCDGEKDPFVVALDAATGNVRWKTPRQTPAKKNFSFSTPLAIKQGSTTQIVSPGSGFVGGYDFKDGHEIWRVGYGEGYSVVPRPVLAHGLLFVSSSYDKATLYAIRPEGAKGDATATNIAWSQPKGAPHTASTVVVGKEVYFVSDAGIATCADAVSGNVYWTERLGGNFSASPIAAEGRLYFLNETGVGVILKASTTYELISKNELGEATLASPAVIDGSLFIRSENHLWRIGNP